MPTFASATASRACWRRKSPPATDAPRYPPLGRLGAERDVLARPHQLAEGPDGRCDLARRVCPAGAAQPDLRIVALPPAIAGIGGAGARLSADDDHSEPCRRPARNWTLQGQEGRDVRAVESGHRR